MTRFEQAAVDLAIAGYHVFPVRERGKDPLTLNGFKDATRDERKILHWWDRWPQANIGVACGASGLAVVDIDAKHGADPDEEILELGLEEMPIVRTGEAPERDDRHPLSLSGVRGAHVLLAGPLPTGDTQRTGVEIRGEGAYVVAPPSAHPSGVPYEGAYPPVSGLAAVPASVRAILASRNGNGPAPVIGERIEKGTQHKTLVSLAGSMRKRGMGEQEIAAALKVTNRQRLADPAPDADIEAIARSVCRLYAPGATEDNGTADEVSIDRKRSELAGLLGLADVGLSIMGAEIFGRGSTASANLNLSNGEQVVFESLRDFANPSRLAVEMAATTEAMPALKTPMALKALTLLRAIAEHHETLTEDAFALAWGTDFLQSAQFHPVDMDDQADRWRAFQRLEHTDPVSTARGEGSSIARQSIVLVSSAGIQFVRCGWFLAYVRQQAGSFSSAELGHRMERVGWLRSGSDGRIKATCPDWPQTLLWTFYTVPVGWEMSR